MKNLYLYGCLLLLTFSSFGQGLINNHWQLGQTDLNFTNPTPTASVVSSGNYGLATVSDASGVELFYTDGNVVWNKNHSIMTNGTQIGRHAFNVAIVPNPANSNQYFIIKAEDEECLCTFLLPTYYLYSIVEFNAANPLGIVLNINSAPTGIENNYSKFLVNASGNLVENVFFYGPLTVTKNLAADSYWVIIQDKNKILSYKIDSSGFNQTPVESTFLAAQIYQYGTYNTSHGCINGMEGATIRITPNNSKLVGLQFSKTGDGWDMDNEYATYKSYFYTLDFNPVTGTFSNYQLLQNPGAKTYSFEISNNSNNLFYERSPISGMQTFNNGEILVKDLSNPTVAPRLVYEHINTTIASSKFSYLQRDRNGNLLVSSVFTDLNKNKYIHRIENQDSYMGSTVHLNYVYLNDKVINRLPQLIPSLAEASPCPTNLVVTTNVASGTDTKQASGTITASNVISNPAIGIYHAGTSVILTNGFHAANGSRFRGYIEGCTGNFLGKDSEEKDVVTEEADLLETEAKVTLYPNPSSSLVTVSLTNSKLKRLVITSIEGKVVFSQNVESSNAYQLDVTNFSKGIYILSVETEDGKLFTEKLIKR